MPRPCPLFEIYVHAPGVEGIHLRGGKVARGGLRHSDRADDFRTEVLGLQRTQALKNVVIVPQGAKGGFVTRKVAPSREEARAQYEVFIAGLLDVTDNYVGSKIVPPPGVRALRRRRSVPGGRRRQGHRAPVRHRERHLAAVQVLDRRCVRVRRLGRLRPQGDGHHLARRVDQRRAPLPRDGDRHPQDVDPGRRRRRHGRRRVRQRHAAERSAEAGRRVQPQARVHRSDAGSRDLVRRAPAAVHDARARSGATTTRS